MIALSVVVPVEVHVGNCGVSAGRVDPNPMLIAGTPEGLWIHGNAEWMDASPWAITARRGNWIYVMYVYANYGSE